MNTVPYNKYNTFVAVQKLLYHGTSILLCMWKGFTCSAISALQVILHGRYIYKIQQFKSPLYRPKTYFREVNATIFAF